MNTFSIKAFGTKAPGGGFKTNEHPTRSGDSKGCGVSFCNRYGESEKLRMIYIAEFVLNGMKTRKILLVLWMVLISMLADGQTVGISTRFRSAFEGTWQNKQKYNTNTVRIRFEAGKDYALFTDIGNGMAPACTLKAIPQGDLLVIPAQQNRNDYIELQIVKGRLHLKAKPVNWDENGKEIKNDGQAMDLRVFKRIREIEK